MRKEIYENQESSDTLPFHWEFGKEEITLKVSSYAYGNGLAVLMYSQSEGELELFSDLTVNLPGGYGLKTQEAFVSGDFTRDKLAFIQENRLGKVLPGQARSGFATYTPVAFDLSRLSRYDRFFLKDFSQADCIAGDCMQGSSLEVVDELDLAFAISGCRRDC